VWIVSDSAWRFFWGQSGMHFAPDCDCAQVAERLMAADCKSAAPWSYGGSNPPLCTRYWQHVFEQEQG
jgi:hypothetical protein